MCISFVGHTTGVCVLAPAGTTSCLALVAGHPLMDGMVPVCLAAIAPCTCNTAFVRYRMRLKSRDTCHAVLSV